MIKFAPKIGSLIAGFLLVLPLSNVSANHIDGQLILRERLDLYRQAFPDIVFEHAQGGEHWKQEYNRIASLLGEKPDALDYEHPPRFANDLMIVTMDRLASMLRRNEVSETLFRAGQQSTLKGSMVCVISLDPQEMIGSDLAATAYMIGLPDSVLAKIHPGRRLNPQDFLFFAIDHEVYHCLESAFIGGAPMTKKTFGGEYNQYRRENGADAFALAMHRRDAKEPSQFAQNIMLVRSLWFLDGGPCYRTYNSLKAIQAMPRDELKNKTLKELVYLADAIRNKDSENYETFVEHQAIALQAAQQIGYEPSDYGPGWGELAQRKADSRRITANARYYLQLYGHLFDNKSVGFQASKPKD
jgi:hypothetical protein